MAVDRIGSRARLAALLVLIALGSVAPVVEAQTPGTLDSSFLFDGSVGATDIADFPSALPIAVADGSGRLVIAEATSASDGAMVLRRISDDGAQLIRHIAVFAGSPHRAWALTRLGNGGFVVVGMANVSGNRYLFVTRLTSALAVDTTFGSGGFVTRFWGGFSIRNADVAVAADGSIYVAGGSTGSSGGNVSFLIRWSSTGVRTYEYREMEFGNDEAIARVLPTPDGKILLAGWTRSSSPDEISPPAVTSTWFVERRFGASGVIDGSFGTLGKSVVSWPVLPPTVRVFFMPETIHNQLGGALRDASGRIYLAGQVTTTWGTLPYLVRLTASGAPDPAFGASGKLIAPLGSGAMTTEVRDVALATPAGLPPVLLLWGTHCPVPATPARQCSRRGRSTARSIPASEPTPLGRGRPSTLRPSEFPAGSIGRTSGALRSRRLPARFSFQFASGTTTPTVSRSNRRSPSACASGRRTDCALRLVSSGHGTRRRRPQHPGGDRPAGEVGR
jgi:uncharacterized delta-60 repeat protein